MQLKDASHHLTDIQVARNGMNFAPEVADARELPSTDRSTIKIYLQEIGKTPLLKPTEEVELAALIQQGDRRAREKMITANLRLVVKIANDYSNFGLPLLDLISEGNIGLIKAVERFDPSKGGKLSTYAAWWIKQSIKRALANQSKTIRLPVHLVDKIARMRRMATELEEVLGRVPTDEEIAFEMDMSVNKVAHLKSVSVRPASLHAPIGDDDGTEFGDLIGDETSALLTGAILVEKIFAWPGVGLLIIDSLSRSDLPLIQASIAVVAALVITVNLLVDFSYRYFKPEITFSRGR